MRFSILPTGKLYWCINKDDPETQPLKSYPGWSFINPLSLYEIINQTASEHNDRSQSYIHLREPEIYAIDNEIYVSTEYLILLENEDGVSELRHDYLEDLGHFLSNLRYSSKQYGMPTGVGPLLSIILKNLTQVPSPNFPLADPDSQGWTRTYPIDAAITWKDVAIAGDLPRDFTPPVFDTIFLDALQAFAARDYRLSILYSAMSAEILATTKLDEIYEIAIEEARQDSKTNNELRIISLPQAGNQVIMKDPIYVHLANRTNFAQLLHERPLYLMRRSILVENQQLYNAAMKLYNTRNKIAHLGEPPTASEKHYEMNQSGALEALECATELFKWFGETSQYPIPKPDSVYKVQKPHRPQSSGPSLTPPLQNRL